jgi:hypothetical protein
VFLVYNTGLWVDVPGTNSFGYRTSSQIASLFTSAPVAPAAALPVVFTKSPTVGQTYFVIVYDPPPPVANGAFNGVEIWMINNLAPLASVEANECTLIGQMSAYGNLWSALNSSSAIVL